MTTHAKMNGVQLVERDGIIIEKGSVLTTNYLEEHQESLGNLLSIFSGYPDIFLDVIKPVDSEFTLYFYQRIVLRALMRYQDIYITAPRALTESAHKIGLIAGNP